MEHEYCEISNPRCLNQPCLIFFKGIIHPEMKIVIIYSRGAAKGGKVRTILRAHTLLGPPEICFISSNSSSSNVIEIINVSTNKTKLRLISASPMKLSPPIHCMVSSRPT